MIFFGQEDKRNLKRLLDDKKRHEDTIKIIKEISDKRNRALSGINLRLNSDNNFLNSNNEQKNKIKSLNTEITNLTAKLKTMQS